MIYLSASSIKDYLSCNRKYWYRRYHPDLSVPTEDTHVGTLVHEMIEKYGTNPTGGFSYLESLIGSRKNSRAFARVSVLMEKFYESFQVLLSDTDQIERQFKIDWSPNVKIVGKIDRILTGGTVVDWKTNRNFPKVLNSDPQFILYYVAYTKLFGKPPSAVFLGHINSGQLIPYRHSKELEKYLWESLIPKMLDDIQDSVNNDFPDGLFRYTTCKYCFYRKSCHTDLGLEKKNELDSKEFNFK